MRRSVAGLLLLAVLVLICASPAYAVTTNPGDRAPELAGWDIVGQRSVSIDDFRGQWVLVEFSAAWCRPCMKQLPDFLAAVQPYRASGQLTVIMVSLDTPETLPDMRRVIKDHAIDFPVLYDGGKYQSVPYLEWNVYGAPSTYLVDSQGVIAAAGCAASRWRRCWRITLTSRARWWRCAPARRAIPTGQSQSSPK